MNERRDAQRHAVVLPASCSGHSRGEFHAITVDISGEGIRLRSATIPFVEESLICNIRRVGLIDARVVWVSSCEFALRVTRRTPDPGLVARRLMELAREQARSSDTIRIHRRIVPVVTGVEVTLPGGARVPATIANLSASGVALHLDIPVAVGQSIIVGRRLAIVARQLGQGIGAAFLEPLDPDTVDERIVL